MLATNVRVQTPPNEEPVTLAEAKAQMRIVVNDEDALITRLIATARRHCERVARRAFVTRTLEAVLDGWPCDEVIALLYPPLSSVVHIKYMDYNGQEHTIPSADYIVDKHSEPGRVMPVGGKTWPGDVLQPLAAIVVRYVAGFGAAAAVPDDYKSCILAYTAAYYENREVVVTQQGITSITLPYVDALLLADRGSF